MENIIHEVLKDDMCIHKAKGHQNILKMTIVCTEWNLPFATFFITHQIVCSTQVNLGVHLGMTKLIQ
jgi:hypothetical protein